MLETEVYVVVPVYKVEPYLKRCVDSILSQSVRDFALVLVDDGSPDRCGEICDEYAKKDARVAVIHQTNRGLAGARNSGIDYVVSKGNSEYITFVDSDDWVEPDYLKTLIEGISCDVDVSCVTFASVDSRGGRHVRYPDVGWKVMPPEDYWTGDETGNQISAWGKLYKVSLFDGVRYPEGKLMEDAFTTHRILFEVPKLAMREVPLYNYYIGSQSIMRSAWTIRQLDEVEAFCAERLYFASNGYARAECKAKALWLTAMAKAIEPLSCIDSQKAKEYASLVSGAIAAGELPFWNNRQVYRSFGVRYYWLRWIFGMLCNFVRQGRRSWLMRESIPIARLFLYRIFKR